MLLEMIYQNNKMTHWIIWKNNQCFTSFYTYKAKCNKDIIETEKNALVSF